VGKHSTATQATDDSLRGRTHLACWLTKATNTHSQYIILTAFPLQQWFREGTSVLRNTSIACLVDMFTCFEEAPQYYMYIACLFSMLNFI
jgi:hypothetical protein